MRPSARTGRGRRGRVTDAVDLTEHPPGLRRIVVVPEGQAAGDRQHAVLIGTGDHVASVVGEDAARCPSPRTSWASRRRREVTVERVIIAFRRTERVDDGEPGDSVEQRLLARGAERHARRHDRAQRRQVERAASRGRGPRRAGGRTSRRRCSSPRRARVSTSRHSAGASRRWSSRSTTVPPPFRVAVAMPSTVRVHEW